MTFSAIFTQLQGLFSKAFWFGSFLPLAIFVAVNLCVASVVFPGSVEWSAWLKTSGDSWTYLPLTIAGLVVVAYAVSPLVAVFRAFIDGTLLPNAVRESLRRDRAPQIQRLLAERRSAMIRLHRLRKLATEDLSRLARARQEGISAGSKKAQPTLDSTIAAVDALRQALADGRALAPENMSNPIDDLARELSSTNARLVERLEAAYDSFVVFVNESEKNADNQLSAMLARTQSLGISLDRPQPTRLGDARANVEEYTLDVYSADFDFIWPRIQLVVPKDSPLIDRIAAAHGQVDFAALSLFLSAIFPVAWGIVLLLHPVSARPVLVIGVITPAILFFLYELLVKSQLLFGEVVKVVIDQYRLDRSRRAFRSAPSSPEWRCSYPCCSACPSV